VPEPDDSFADPPPPPVVSYASLHTGGLGRRSRHPAVAVAMFIGGMLGPAVAVAGGLAVFDRIPWALWVLLIGPPVVMFVVRGTRLVAAGWVTSIALVFIAILVICGRM
jgi:hypothetical protein